MPVRSSRHLVVDADECVSADVTLVRAFDLLGKRWTGVLLGTLRDGAIGFRALSRAMPGISDSVLSDRLSELANASLIVRCVAEGPPVSVSYTLTEAGEALLPALNQISKWAQHYLPGAPPPPRAAGRGRARTAGPS